uniref:Uncharacterized protein n=1 Tax=Romanomermis culicivorax TaxID=13658 RepID=A0A915L594_ROMCU
MCVNFEKIGKFNQKIGSRVLRGVATTAGKIVKDWNQVSSSVLMSCCKAVMTLQVITADVSNNNTTCCCSYVFEQASWIAQPAPAIVV